MKKLKILTILLVLPMLLGLSSTALAAPKAQQSQFTAPILIANTSFLNVRTGPGVQYTVLVTVVGGTSLPVLGVASDGVWYQVSTVAGNGWVNVDFTIPRGDFTNVPLIELSDIVPVGSSRSTQSSGTTGTTATTPSTTTTTTTSVSTARRWGISITENHPARVSATINSNSPGTIVENPARIYAVIDGANADGITWFRVDDPAFGLIWVEGTKTVPRPLGCGDISVVVFTTRVTPGVGPDGTGSIESDRSFEGGQEAYLLDFVNSLYRVEFVDGETGWINSADAVIRNDENIAIPACTGATTSVNPITGNSGTTGTTTNPPVERAVVGPVIDSTLIAIVNTSFLNVRSGPGAQFTVVRTLSGGTTLDVLGVAADGVWFLVEGTFGRGWLNGEFVIFRGDGSLLPTIQQATGAVVNTPIATITNAVTVFAAPNEAFGSIGAISGVTEVDIVARTADLAWVQVRSAVGTGWVRTSEVAISGDLSLVPVVE